MLEAASSISGRTVGPALDRAMVGGQVRRSITVDHGTEFMSRALEDRPFARGVQLDFMRPGNPWKTRLLNRLTADCAVSA
jgi:putative transposase